MTLIIALIDGDSDRKAFIGFIVDDVTDDDREFRRVRRAVDTLGDVIDRYGDAGRDIILKLTNIKTNVGMKFYFGCGGVALASRARQFFISS